MLNTGIEAINEKTLVGLQGQKIEKGLEGKEKRDQDWRTGKETDDPFSDSLLKDRSQKAVHGRPDERQLARQNTVSTRKGRPSRLSRSTMSWMRCWRTCWNLASSAARRSFSQSRK